jgi:hypothetical protein
MKQVLSNYANFTEEFNLLGKIVIGTVTGLIIACCLALVIGLILQGAPAVIGY